MSGRWQLSSTFVFEDWFGRSASGVIAPRIDVAEDERCVTLMAELPGVNEKDIDISLVGDQLTIKGEKRWEHEEKRTAKALPYTAWSGRTVPSRGR